VYNGERDLVNIRTYDPEAPAHRRKIWSVRGHGQDRLYPIGRLHRAVAAGSPIIVCEGEWDALLTLQAGHLAITRTGSATSWKPEWGDLFNGLLVFVCQDCDRSGVEGAAKIGRNLSSAGAEVRYMRLPYPIKRKHGKDLTDYLLANDHDPSRALAWLKKGATTTPPEE
jgi:DNA primase